MGGRRFEVAWREEDATEVLKAGYQGERDPQLRTRMHGLWLLRSGWRLASVAAAVGVHYRTVQQWVGWYREGGIPKVLSHKMGGKGQEPFLANEAQEQVAQEVATGGFRTAGAVWFR
jgi:transposase